MGVNQDLVTALENIESTLIERRIGVLIVDSIAALVRNDFTRSGAERSSALVAQAATLKRISDVFNLAVLVTNQVTTHMGDLRQDGDIPSNTAHIAQRTFITGTSHSLAMAVDTEGGGNTHAHTHAYAQGEEEGGKDAEARDDFVVPALGNTWHHCVSTRLVMEQFPSHRTVSVAKSPIAPFTVVECKVTESGLVELSTPSLVAGGGSDDDGDAAGWR